MISKNAQYYAPCFPTLNSRIALSGSTIFILTDDSGWKYVDIDKTAITEDGRYYVNIYASDEEGETKTYATYGNISINYTSGEVTCTDIDTVELPILEHNDRHRLYYAMFMGSSKVLIFRYETYINGSYGDATVAYSVDFNNTRDSIFTPISSFSLDFPASVGTASATYLNTNNLVAVRSLYKVDPDYSEVVALKYNDEYYYKHEKGMLSATKEDVLKGRTFIGYNGAIETGIAEIKEEEE